MDNIRRILLSSTILLILALLVVPVAADETLTDTTITTQPGKPWWYVEHRVEEDDRIRYTLELISGSGFTELMMVSSTGHRQYLVTEVTGTASHTWKAPYTSTWRFYVINKSTGPQQVHLTLVKLTGPCLGTMIIAVFPVIAMACILGKRYLS